MANYTDPNLSANDRVALYFESIIGRPMTREEKTPLSVVIFGEPEDCLIDAFDQHG